MHQRWNFLKDVDDKLAQEREMGRKLLQIVHAIDGGDIPTIHEHIPWNATEFQKWSSERVKKWMKNEIGVLDEALHSASSSIPTGNELLKILQEDEVVMDSIIERRCGITEKIRRVSLVMILSVIAQTEENAPISEGSAEDDSDDFFYSSIDTQKSPFNYTKSGKESHFEIQESHSDSSNDARALEPLNTKKLQSLGRDSSLIPISPKQLSKSASPTSLSQSMNSKTGLSQDNLISTGLEGIGLPQSNKKERVRSPKKHKKSGKHKKSKKSSKREKSKKKKSKKMKKSTSKPKSLSLLGDLPSL